MKKIIIAILIGLTSASFAQNTSKITEPVEWVNPFMGTDSKYALSNCNTYPTIALPWGMNFWTPQTGGMVMAGNTNRQLIK